MMNLFDRLDEIFDELPDTEPYWWGLFGLPIPDARKPMLEDKDEEIIGENEEFIDT
jgi:hypothetical protein